MGNGCVAGDLALQQGARRENILYGSLTDEQRCCSGKDPQPCGLSSGRPLAGLLLSHRAPLAMLLRRALPAARQSLAHSFPIMRWVLAFCSSPTNFNSNSNYNTYEIELYLCSLY